MKNYFSHMRRLLCASTAVFFVTLSFAQTPQLTKEQWENAKQQNQLNGQAPASYIHADALPVVTRIAPNVPVTPATTSCSCWQQRDASFSVVPFDFYSPPDYRNDDGSTAIINLPFSFCLYGQSWTNCYINNNGNVSFGAPYGTFTATGFPNASFEMVAPFWADVDTRNLASGLVYYKITPTYMIVQWDSVGYYSNHTNLVNTFQLIITDGSDPIVPNGNVSFCYKDMQWTTGDASSGVGGFNGSDAIVGANRGDGVNYIQFGSFNQPGGNYNGPAGPNSGIDWLDNQSFTFDACTNSNNIPPTISGINPCDTFRICENDTFHLNPQFFSPEIGQTTTITVSAPGVNGYTIVSNTPGNTAQLISYLVGQPGNLGYNTITVTATDDGTPNAVTSVTVVILVTPSPTATSTSVGTTCGGNNGSASVTASGGSGTYTYSWSPSGGNAATATGLGAGTYTCTITDASSGCSDYESVTVAGSSGVSLTNSFSDISCNGGNNGSATVNPSGGSGTYSYSWTPSGGNAATATGLPAGSYTCNVTDSNGCTAQQAFNITEPTALSVTSSQTDVACNGGTNGSATVTPAGGTPGYTFSWAPSGGNNATANNLTAGTYTCTVTDANSCSTTQSFTITEPPLLTFTIAVTPTTCNGSTATANVTGGTAPYGYSWSNFTFNQTATDLNPGTVSCTVTDANGCTASQSVTITTAPLLTAISSWTSVFCFGDSTGSAGVTANGGTPAYSYSWAPYGGNASSATGLTAGTYTCTITDANGCTLNRSFTLTEPSQVVSSSTQTNNNCFGDTTGTATVTSSGGVPNYTYSWAPSGGNAATATGLAAGIYTCTITDANGCNSTLSVTITQPTQMTCSVSVVNATCNTTGSATATVNGGNPGYTYSWSSGGTSATENNLNAGTYTVTITDANGCVITQTATISVASSITATSTSTNVSCFGNSTGTASVTASGGTTPYTYSWSPSGGTNATATGLGAGTYTCTITDANGCQFTQSVTITQPASAVSATSSHVDVLCNGQSNGSAAVVAGGGTPGYTYAWTPSGGSNAAASGLSAGTYTCTITDANGCTATQTVSVTQPQTLTVNASSNAICPETPGVITATPTGGVGPYTYAWSNGPTTSSQTINVTANTSYTVTVTDANGCSTTGVSNVTLNPVPVASFTTSATDGIYVVNPSTQLCYSASTTGVAAWYWDIMGDTSTSPAPCVNVTSADTGFFCAGLIVVNSSGCTDTAYSCVKVTDVFFNIPNVFTPNGDGVNDVFMITNNGMKTLHCVIYDRWGVLIYEWNSITGYWDGRTNSGNDAVDGVYYWTLDMEDYSGVTYQDHGFVHLIRGK